MCVFIDVNIIMDGIYSLMNVDRHCVPLMLEDFQVHVTIQSRDTPPPLQHVLVFWVSSWSTPHIFQLFLLHTCTDRLRCNTYVQIVYPESWSLFQHGTISQYLIYITQVNIVIVMLHM